ncbi:ABC transporter related protein [Xylanimonas cellulosilytica DSM 15894]|uniref:ABC transporter related protein n=1 Tax=Xylanimonas cellulosilytica (strain DSM 15894 / JCM 12276 / CECT 5975 / KCTC 9989 / LMG 20990 / NBRC 107835 / XIL07) TaxID=446471 RepID=D1BXG1_XYLCX|nr:ATP-binding cassette domain-containing protein [Xylanimonas cellulosilytica]ACZ29771.1 ABC transporter related protein [Xylanimonas cellulosilytica DSM 15894]
MKIEARGLVRSFRTPRGVVHALRGVDLTIPSGSITAVVGHSGAGKTTFGRCVNLLQRPDEGTLTLDGVDVWARSARDRRELTRTIGTIFQGSRLLRRRTAWENVAFPLELAGVAKVERRARALELLDRVGLSDKRDAYPSELSGGQAQRVGIARALSLAPRVLVSDEATSGLDPASTEAILGLIRDIHDDEGLTVVLITHEMEVVRAIADRAALLEDGRTSEEGPVADLLVDHGSRLGRALLPFPSSLADDAGRVQFVVTYRHGEVPGDWIVRASQALDESVELVAASVERRDAGRAFGRATIALPAEVAARVPAVLDALGLDTLRVDEADPGLVGASLPALAAS